MSFVCPKCKKGDELWRGVDVPGWQSVDENLEPNGERDVEWYLAESNYDYGCAACNWEGTKDRLERLGIDGSPLPFVHATQMELVA